MKPSIISTAAVVDKMYSIVKQYISAASVTLQWAQFAAITQIY